MREALGEEEGEVVSRPIKMAEVRVRDLVAFATPGDVAAAIAAAGGCQPGEVKTVEIRLSPMGLATVCAKCPLVAARKVAAAYRRDTSGSGAPAPWIAAGVAIAVGAPSTGWRSAGARRNAPCAPIWGNPRATGWGPGGERLPRRRGRRASRPTQLAHQLAPQLATLSLSDGREVLAAEPAGAVATQEEA